MLYLLQAISFLKKIMIWLIKYIDFVRAMFIETNPAPIKEAMNIMGFNVGECRSPLGPLSDKNREHVRNIINKYGLKK